MNGFSSYLTSISSLIIAGLLFVLISTLLISKSKINESLKTILFIGVIKSIILAFIFIDIGLTDLFFKENQGTILYPLYAIIELLFIIKFLQYITSAKERGEV